MLDANRKVPKSHIGQTGICRGSSELSIGADGFSEGTETESASWEIRQLGSTAYA